MFFLSYFFIFLNIIFIEAKCPASSTKGVNNNKCYYFLSAPVDFITAERNCNELGGYLVSICNAWDNNLLQSVSVGKLQEYGAKDFWIGWNDLSKKGVWQWTNANSSCNNNYTNWNSGQPNGNDCTSMVISGGKWQTNDCTTMKPFVCEVFEETYSAQPQCRDGYSYYAEWNSCYKFFNQSMTYIAAEENCANEGGHLLSIHSSNEEEFIDALIHEQVPYSYFWIGLYTINVNWPNVTSFWRWEDITSVVYTDWFPQHPNNRSPCAGMVTSNNPWSGNKSWDNNHLCNETWSSVCKQPPICS